MEDLSVGPSPAELALIEGELPEWDRLVVQDYWDAVVAEELEKAPLVVQSDEPRDFKSRQGVRTTRRVRNTGNAAVLRLVLGDDVPASRSDREAA